MKSAISLALSMWLVSSAFPVAAQDGIAATPGPIARAISRTDLVEGARVGLELVDGRHLVGEVGTRTDDGFYMGDTADARSFVRYRDVRALLDPDTGTVIQTYTPPPNH